MSLLHINIVVSGNMPGANTMENIKRELHLEAPILGGDLLPIVQARTPVMTGALLSSITAIPNPGGDDLLWMFPEDGEQLMMWGRIYATYQEGPPQGLETYTNPPRKMFEGTVEGVGQSIVEAWAMNAVSTGLLLPGGSSFGGGAYTII